MCDTIFKRNLNKFLCDLSQVNCLYFYHSSKFLCYSLFLDFILEDFSVICFCTFFERTLMKTTLSDGGLLLKEDFFTLNIIIIIII